MGGKFQISACDMTWLTYKTPFKMRHLFLACFFTYAVMQTANGGASCRETAIGFKLPGWRHGQFANVAEGYYKLPAYTIAVCRNKGIEFGYKLCRTCPVYSKHYTSSLVRRYRDVYWRCQDGVMSVGWSWMHYLHHHVVYMKCCCSGTL